MPKTAQSSLLRKELTHPKCSGTTSEKLHLCINEQMAEHGKQEDIQEEKIRKSPQ